jgi:hypothetical protein
MSVRWLTKDIYKFVDNADGERNIRSIARTESSGSGG